MAVGWEWLMRACSTSLVGARGALSIETIRRPVMKRCRKLSAYGYHGDDMPSATRIFVSTASSLSTKSPTSITRRSRTTRTSPRIFTSWTRISVRPVARKSTAIPVSGFVRQRFTKWWKWVRRPACENGHADGVRTNRQLQINFSNCVHCKTCDIMDPYNHFRDLVQNLEPRRIKIEDILRIISRHYGVSKGDLLSQRRHRSVVWPRQIGMYWRSI